MLYRRRLSCFVMWFSECVLASLPKCCLVSGMFERVTTLVWCVRSCAARFRLGLAANVIVFDTGGRSWYLTTALIHRLPVSSPLGTGDLKLT
ncbi:uncharacterized protein B0H18DRAFT_78686 [Fomitopsis serialis]|uniref:uncharacterized protein n=1 Tax=Fomitopsis serialis TaxID=139415 RepID=UPI0020075FF1|nr:uncharacterized protein B0H18DRAFT_78686 [Neoantrodia serialis]KAH9915871.1 hypothetical protein B0H18DRAFT_78686 [Neoantrodia serialis]